jgi:Fic family protein
MHIFNETQREKAQRIEQHPLARISSLSSGEIRDLCCVWCYYSGKIEGNTYTYVETESLLKDGITSEKRYEDAKMLKNLYNAFNSELEYIHRNHHQEVIDERTVLRIHGLISDGLVSAEERGQFRSRPVRISGTTYIPPKHAEDIRMAFNEILFRQTQIESTLERAVYLHCNLARIQPFIDGNKRTARMMESLVMMNADLIPCYSAQDRDILAYRRGLVHFYETEDYTAYANYFLNRLLERLAEIES